MTHPPVDSAQYMAPGDTETGYTFLRDVGGSPNSIRTCNTTHSFTFTTNGASGQVFHSTDTPVIRCDTSTFFYNGTTGCVFSDFIPTMTNLSVSDPTVGQAAAFYRQAQTDGFPGRYTPLNRLQDSYAQDQNYKQSCRQGFVPQNTNDSCDEYPFASTYQGSYTSGRQAEVAHIPLDQNKKAGSLLQSFFYYNRVIDPDPFYVFITN